MGCVIIEFQFVVNEDWLTCEKERAMGHFPGGGWKPAPPISHCQTLLQLEKCLALLKELKEDTSRGMPPKPWVGRCPKSVCKFNEFPR